MGNGDLRVFSADGLVTAANREVNLGWKPRTQPDKTGWLAEELRSGQAGRIDFEQLRSSGHSRKVERPRLVGDDIGAARPVDTGAKNATLAAVDSTVVIVVAKDATDDGGRVKHRLDVDFDRRLLLAREPNATRNREPSTSYFGGPAGC